MSGYLTHRQGNRILVGTMIAGTNVLSVVADYPLAAARQAVAYARSKNQPVHVEVPPEERSIPKGFYEDQGNLF